MRKLRGTIPEIPVAMFASVMGIGGLGLAWRRAATVVDVHQIFGEVLIAVSAVLFALLAALYGLKAIRNPAAIMAELRDIVGLNFFATITLSMFVLAGGALAYDETIAEIIWIVAAAGQLFLAVVLIARWLRETPGPANIVPSMFLPVAGIVYAPATGVPLGHIEASWLLFTLGALFWVIVLSLLFARLFLHSPIPSALLPGIAILVAPPALAFSAYVELTFHVVDALAHFFLYASVIMAIFTVSLVDRIWQVPFNVNWWGVTFPLDALAAAICEYHGAIGTRLSDWMVWGVLILTTLVVMGVTVETGRRMANGTMFPALGHPADKVKGRS